MTNSILRKCNCRFARICEVMFNHVSMLFELCLRVFWSSSKKHSDHKLECRSSVSVQPSLCYLRGLERAPRWNIGKHRIKPKRKPAIEFRTGLTEYRCPIGIGIWTFPRGGVGLPWRKGECQFVFNCRSLLFINFEGLGYARITIVLMKSYAFANVHEILFVRNGFDNEFKPVTKSHITHPKSIKHNIQHRYKTDRAVDRFVIVFACHNEGQSSQHLANTVPGDVL